MTKEHHLVVCAVLAGLLFVRLWTGREGEPGRTTSILCGKYFKVKDFRSGNAVFKCGSRPDGGLRLSGAEARIFFRKLDLNKATAPDLEELPGVGPGLSKEIAAARRRNGRFKKIDQLLEVKGIGKKRFDTLKRWVEAESE